MPQQLYVGQPCPVCGTPAVQGKKGAYCKPCYVKWAESSKSTTTGYKTAPQGNQGLNLASTTRDYDKENYCKCKYGFLIALLNKHSMQELYDALNKPEDYTFENMEDLSEKFATMSMRKLDRNKQPVNNEGIDVSGIPF